MQGRWAVAVTQIQQQERVVEQLIGRGFEYFWPRVRRTVRQRGRRVHRLDSLLFNYVPVRLSEDWPVIFDMRGVVDVLGPADSRQIAELKSRCDGADILIEPKHKSQFKPGQKVSPNEGGFAGMVGNYVGFTNDDRETALFLILGARRSIKFETGTLVAA